MTKQITRASGSGIPYPALVSLGFTVFMTVMFYCITFKAPQWLTFVLSLGSMVLAFAIVISKSTYVLTEDGISVEHKPILNIQSLKKKTKFYPWTSLVTYRLEEKMVRSGELKKYLEIWFRKPAEKLVIYQGDSAAELESFFLSFLSIVENLNREKAAASPQNVQLIKAKPSFYVSFPGRLLTIFFLGLVAGASWLLLKYELFMENIVFVFLMIFAASYLVYRSFLHKRN